ncbi:MAG: aminoglycoside phosphotransferase family protein [Minisyncoccia bacterium]
MEGPDEKKPEGSPERIGTVTFRNQPRTGTDNALLARYEDERKEIVDRLEGFLQQHDRLKGKDVTVEYFSRGVSSLAMKIEAPNETVVLKIPFEGDPTDGEAFALHAWKEVGVMTPDVLDIGKIGNSNYILLQYLPVGSIIDVTTHEERVESDIYEYLGRTLRKMHRVQTDGYGPIDGKGRGAYPTFEEALPSFTEGKDGTYVIEQGLMDATHLKRARTALVTYEQEHPGGVLCHTDYGLGNALASNPPAIFDPAPTSTIPYMDIGRAVYGLVTEGDQAIERFIASYEQGDGNELIQLDRKLIHAAVIYVSIHKLAKSHRKQHDPELAARIPRIQGYLERNQHLVPDTESELKIESPTRVTFLNEPIVSEDPRIKEFEEERKAIRKEIQPLIENHERFKSEHVRVKFFHSGFSSLVCQLETDSEKTILKFPLGVRPTKGIAIALREWEKTGSPVTHVIEDGDCNGHPYILMSFVNAPTLDEERDPEAQIQNGDFIRIGATVRGLHRSEGRGFGTIGADGYGEFATFEEWLNADTQLASRSSYVIEHGLVDANTIAKARTILLEHSAAHPESTICHMDVAAGNFFDTEPLTTSDPTPMMNLPYIDMGKSIANTIHNGGEQAIQQLIQGYEAENIESHLPTLALDRRVLHAATVLALVQKLRYSHKTGGAEMEARTALHMRYLADNENLLIRSN